MKINSKRIFLHLIILITTTLITYFNILPNQLFFDDEELIYKNIYVQNLKYFPHFFTENMVAGAGKISNMYRPVLLTSFSIDWNIWRGSPIGFHFTSILLHLINTTFVYFLILILFKDVLVSFLTALFFSVHPAISEAVIYTSGRTDPLYSMFTLVSLIFFLLFIKSKNKLFYPLSLLCFLVSLGSKETAVIAPFLIFLTFIIYQRKNLRKLKVIKLFILFLPFLALTIFYSVSRLTFLNFSNSLNFYKIQTAYSSSFVVRALTFTRSFFEYLFLFIFPKDLIIAREVPIIISPFNPYVILLLTVIFVLIFLIIMADFMKIWLQLPS